MATKLRPSLLDNPELRGVSILDDLDSFLDGEGGSVSEHSLPSLYLGRACVECKEAGEGKEALVSATVNGHKTCLQDIIAAQPKLDLKTVLVENSTTLAHLAARNGHSECLQLLLEADGSLSEMRDKRGASPLHVCSYHGHLECIKCLFSEGLERTPVRDMDGATPVHFAASSGHTDCLKVLVEEGYNPNDQTESGETPVYFSAQEGHLDSVQYLVETAKADPTVSSMDGMTPLHAAAQTGRLHITHWLVRSAKCPVMCRTCDGATPVHFAAAKGHVAILEWMLHHSLATGLEQDDFGATPVHDAAEQGQLECLGVFYNHSVNLEVRDNDGMIPLDLAKEKEYARCVQFLQNPERSFQEAKKDTKNAELRLLIDDDDQKVGTSISKRKRFGSFLSWKKPKTTSTLPPERRKKHKN